MTHSVSRALVVAFAAGLCLAPTGTALAQPEPAAPQTDLKEPEKLKPRSAEDTQEQEPQFRVRHADVGRYDSARNLFYLSGNIEFQDGETKLYCDEAIYNNDEDTAACGGNIRIVEKETTITGELINADFEAETIRIEGNAKIVSTKKPKPPEDAAEGPRPDKPRVTTVTCDRIDYTYTEGERRALATGHLKVTQEKRTVRAPQADYDREKGVMVLGHGVTIEFADEEMQVTCDKITYQEEDDTAVCTGKVRMFDEETVLTGEKIIVDFEPELATITGSVKIVTTRRSKAEKDKAQDDPEGEPGKRVTTITCDKIDYTYTEGKRRALATGNVKAVQKDRTLYAQKADYDRETGLVVLGDKVTVEAEDGKGRCTKATVHVDEDWVIMEPFDGWTYRKKKSRSESPAAGEPTTTEAAAPPGE